MTAFPIDESGAQVVPPDSALVPPMVALSSTTSTFIPRSAENKAVARPAAPEPRTTTSYCVFSGAGDTVPEKSFMLLRLSNDVRKVYFLVISNVPNF